MSSVYGIERERQRTKRREEKKKKAGCGSSTGLIVALGQVLVVAIGLVIREYRRRQGSLSLCLSRWRESPTS